MQTRKTLQANVIERMMSADEYKAFIENYDNAKLSTGFGTGINPKYYTWLDAVTERKISISEYAKEIGEKATKVRYGIEKALFKRTFGEE